jgi:hypothetical protein
MALLSLAGHGLMMVIRLVLTVLGHRFVKAVLTKPIVRVQSNTRTIVIIPSGDSIELQDLPYQLGLVDIEWDGHCFSVFRDDLLDACTIDDAARVSFFRGRGSFQAR